MRTQTYSVSFLGLVADPHINKVLREDIALQEERMIFLETVQRFLQAAGHLRDFGMLFGWQFVQVLIHWLTRLDLVDDTVQTRHEQRGKAEIRIRRRIGRTIFDALGLGILTVGGNTNGSAA